MVKNYGFREVVTGLPIKMRLCRLLPWLAIQPFRCAVPQGSGKPES